MAIHKIVSFSLLMLLLSALGHSLIEARILHNENHETGNDQKWMYHRGGFGPRYSGHGGYGFGGGFGHRHGNEGQSGVGGTIGTGSGVRSGVGGGVGTGTAGRIGLGGGVGAGSGSRSGVGGSVGDGSGSDSGSGSGKEGHASSFEVKTNAVGSNSDETGPGEGW